MDRETVIALLRAHEPDLRAAGIARLSLFGSMARGDNREDSDVAVRLTEEATRGGFAYFGRLEAIRTLLTDILGCSVDVVVEPVRQNQLRHAIETEHARAF